jgi:hypothetical protein
MEKTFEEVFGKCICEVTREDVIKSMITNPEQWTKEQIIEFLKENF